VLASGCTVTHVESLEGGGWKMRRYSLLQKTQFPQLTVLKDGVSVDGYSNNTDSEAIRAAVEAAVQSAVKAAVTP
jgi:hypothetical protein